MYQLNDESTLAKILAFGAAATTLLVVTGSVTDPVNATKHFLLGGIAIASLFVLVGKGSALSWRENRFPAIFVALFFVGICVATVFSEAPLGQNVYGTYGRNTGFLAYLFLAIVFLSAAVLRNSKSFKLVVLGLFVAGFMNVLYSAWVLIFGDPINWNNPYGALLGTLGNPNFISSLLGLFSALVVAYLIAPKIKLLSRVVAFFLAGLAIFEISDTNSIQGYVVAAACISFVVFLRIRASKYKVISWAYLVLFAIAGATAVAGVFKVGPLTKFLYQGTMAFREQYWRAAINMGLESPFTGIGMDAYGDSYRASRELAALTAPGVQVVSNSAHNVILDLFASGGLVVLISYLAMITLSALSLLKVVRRTEEFNPVFAVLAATWLGYQLQSLISINQLGLAVWGWLISGALIGYEISIRPKKELDSAFPKSNNSRVVRSNQSVISGNLLGGVGAVIGFLIAVPPLSADSAWANSTKSGNFTQVELALTPSYFHPESSNRYVNVVQVLENSKLHDQARKYALKAVEYNPGNFDSWLALYSIQASTPEEKARAVKMLKKLDPFNPDVTAR